MPAVCKHSMHSDCASLVVIAAVRDDGVGPAVIM
jgi:hypothetical protein